MVQNLTNPRPIGSSLIAALSLVWLISIVLDPPPSTPVWLVAVLGICVGGNIALAAWCWNDARHDSQPRGRGLTP